MKLQTILIPKSWNLMPATGWIKRNGYKIGKIDITENYYRFRQARPLTKKKYHSKTLSNGVVLVFYS